MVKRLFIISLAVLFLSGSGYGQNIKRFLKYGDQSYAEGDYYGASLYYKMALDVDSIDIEILFKYAESLRQYNEYEKAEWYYAKIFKKERGKLKPLAPFWLATMQKHNGKYKTAAATWKKVNRLYIRNKKSYEYLKSKQEMKSCKYAMRAMRDSADVAVSNLGESINTINSEFSAMITPDSTMYFTSLRSDNINENEEVHEAYYGIKIFEADPLGETWKTKSMLDTTINTQIMHNANGSFSTDGKRFYFTRCGDDYKCDIYVSQLSGKSWGKPTKVAGKINGDGYTSTQPFVANVEGDEVLFFVSDMSGSIGKLDIWYSKITGGNQYSKPKNLGKNINSIDNEISPYYDGKDKQLYFSSNWHYGFGGFDIFQAGGTLNKMERPVHLKRPINSSANDMYYTINPKNGKGYLTSNRKGSFFKKGPTCCNDIWGVQYPFEEEKDTLTYKTLEDLNKYLPVTLYFHNDEPNPNTLRPSTTKSYMKAYEDYLVLKPKYYKEFGKGKTGDEATFAKEDITEFFTDYVEKGVKDLAEFLILLKRELDKGYDVELTIKGFASPLAKTDYNVPLTKRRIMSLENYLDVYKGGVYKPYVDGTAASGGRLTFVRNAFGEYTARTGISDDLNEQDKSIFSPEASLERRIEIQSVHLASSNKDSVYAEMKVDKEVHDFGRLTAGDTVSHTYTITNTGNKDLVIERVAAACGCTVASFQTTPVKPGESTEVSVNFDTTDKEGFQVKSITVVTNATPRTKRLVVTSEVFKKTEN
jgi:hypothetical protein